MEGFQEASYEEQELYPRVLKTFHQFMLSEGRSESTAKSYMRSFSSLLSEHGFRLQDHATWKYQEVVKASPRNRAGNGQLSASVKCFIEYWERVGADQYNSGGASLAKLIDGDLRKYNVKDRPRTAGGPPPAKPDPPAKAEGASPAKRAKKEAAEAAAPAKATAPAQAAAPAKAAPPAKDAGGAELLEEYDGFDLRCVDGVWTVLPHDVVSIDIAAIVARTEMSGYSCTLSDDSRCILSGDPAITMHADAGKMEIQTTSKEAVLRAAQMLVDSWLVEGE